MKISTTHKEFADHLRAQTALEYPERFLGPNWKDVLNFWIFIDTLNEDQWKSIKDAHYSLRLHECNLAIDAAWLAAWLAAGAGGCDAALFTSGYAACEIIGSHILKEQGKSLVSFPLYLKFSQ